MSGKKVAALGFGCLPAPFSSSFPPPSISQELQAQLAQRSDQYHRLLDRGESMLLSRGGEDAPGTTQTQQNLALLQNKWASLNGKMDDRRVSRPYWHPCAPSAIILPFLPLSSPPLLLTCAPPTSGK